MEQDSIYIIENWGYNKYPKKIRCAEKTQTTYLIDFLDTGGTMRILIDDFQRDYRVIEDMGPEKLEDTNTHKTSFPNIWSY